MSPTPALRLEGVTVRYGRKTAVERLDLQVQAGEVFGFVGPNGAGKTTAIRVLLDLLRPDSGRVEVLGEDLRRTGTAWRARVGYLPGDLVLFAGTTGEETLRLFGALQGRPCPRREEVLERLGFPMDALRRRVRSYSTGMRQMLGIAIAFQHAPELLILDEPSTGLDPLVQERFLDLVAEEPRHGRTVFFSSHLLEEVEACADRVGLIWRGRLRLEEAIEELRTTRPRRVVLHHADGTKESFAHRGEVGDLLGKLAERGLRDVEIRPVALKEVFRDLVGAEADGVEDEPA